MPRPKHMIPEKRQPPPKLRPGPKPAIALTGGPQPPKLAPDISDRDRAHAHMKYLSDRITWMTAQGAAAKDIAQLSAQYNAAIRLHSRLSGALDVTEAQVIRSAPFQRCMAVLREEWGDDRARLERLISRLETLAGQ